MGRCSFTHTVAHHAWRTEASRHTAHAHALQVVVLACLGTLQPLSPWVVGRTHKLDHGWPTGQAPFAWGKKKRGSEQRHGRSPFCTVLRLAGAITHSGDSEKPTLQDQTLPSLQCALALSQGLHVRPGLPPYLSQCLGPTWWQF